MRYLGRGCLERLVKGRRLLVCLDFDGTLAPLRRDPAAAALSRAKRRILEKLVAGGRSPVAVISGRGIADLEKKIGIPGIVYAGDHGFVIKRGNETFCPFSSVAGRQVKRFYVSLRRGAAGKIRGLLIENKGMTLTVHYRRVSRRMVPAVKTAVRTLAEKAAFLNAVKVREGKECLEVRPAVPWDKGSAVVWLLLKLMKDNGPLLPLYVGDDTTDEDAFEAFRAMGITVRVGKKADSAAEYYVKDTAGVFRILKGLAGGPV